MLKIQMSPQNKFLFAVMGGSLLVLILGQLILSDLGTRSRKDRQQVKLVEKTLIRSLVVRDKREKIMADYKKYQAYLALEHTPPRQVVEEFLREIERIARDAGASIVNLNPRTLPDAAQELAVYHVDLRMECSADQLLFFFKDIKDSKFLIKVERFSVTAKDEQGISLKVEMLLSLRVG